MDESQQQKCDSLLKKYGIPLQHLDFDYIENCTDGRELEKILQILKSGEEGHYPDLIQTTEQRLTLIKPKSKHLRKSCPVLYKQSLNKEETKQIVDDINEWIDNMTKNDNKLERYKNNNNNNTNESPTIRKCKEIESEQKAIQQKQRISSTDYSSWDKYDADAEILKMDLHEEKLKKSVAINQNKTKKTVKFKPFFSDIEAEHQALTEKNKGNEFFKSGDYNQALEYYTNSIQYKPTISALINRALVYLKLQKFNKCIKDCDDALILQPNNIKAILRKTQALIQLNEKHLAFETIQKGVEIDANNSIVQELIGQLRKDCGVIIENTKRYQIEEIDKTDIIPIAGTSKMSPPHFLTSKNPKIPTKKQCGKLQIITIDEHIENDDDCTINHLEHICEKREINRKLNHLKVVETDENAGGEPYIQPNCEIIENLHSPYSFLKAWLSASNDSSLEEMATILKTIDTNRIIDVIGCKLDNSMFTNLLNCLCQHFTVAGEIDRLFSILVNIVQLPRFDIVALLSSDHDKHNIRMLIEFLKQHDRHLSEFILNKFYL